jgi:formate hydrogenlyase subunit 4
MTMTIVWTLHAALVVAWPPLLVGVIRRVKAWMTGRRGPPLLQAYFDLAKFFAKREVLADTTTWVFRAAPWASFGVAVVVGLMVPTFAPGAPLGAHADLILILYLLGLERFVRTLAALDTGTAFGGLGASRESFLSTLAEPAMLLSLWCAGLLAGSMNVPEIAAAFAALAIRELSPVYPLVLLSLAIVTLAENCRIPFDDPTTHLELTMVHEAMGLEYSGRGLALVEWASMTKLGVYLALLANLCLPADVAAGSLATSLAWFVARTTVLAAGVALVESTFARLSFFRLAELLELAGAAAVLALIRIVTVGR